jgi:hypothetical protein
LKRKPQLFRETLKQKWQGIGDLWLEPVLSAPIPVDLSAVDTKRTAGYLTIADSKAIPTIRKPRPGFARAAGCGQSQGSFGE